MLNCSIHLLEPRLISTNATYAKANIAPRGLILVSLFVLGLCFFMLGGCAGGAKSVRVSNHSDVDVTIRLYVGDRADALDSTETGNENEGGLVPLYHTEKHLAHLRAGRSRTFPLKKNVFYKREAREPVIRLWVESRAPSFANDPERVREHWIELVSFPPVSITIEGERNELRFAATKGEITLIPRDLWLNDPDPLTVKQASAENE